MQSSLRLRKGRSGSRRAAGWIRNRYMSATTRDWLTMAMRTARSVASASFTSTKSSAAHAAPVAPLGPVRLRLAAARTGDHPSIHAFLLSVFQGPSAAEFHAQLEEPGYQPSNRLLVKQGDELKKRVEVKQDVEARQGNEIVAHLRLARQTIHM